MDYIALVLAIGMVESGGNPEAIGKNGEVSHMQLSSQMILEYNEAFREKGDYVTYGELKLNPALAEKMFVQLVMKFVEDPTPTKAAHFWQLGRGYKSKYKSKAVKVYAQRVNALYEFYKGELRVNALYELYKAEVEKKQ